MFGGWRTATRGLTKLSAGRVIFACTAVVVVYFLAMFAVNVVQSRHVIDQEERLEADIAELQARYERLQSIQHYLASDQYIEAVAREQLGLVKPGETGFVAISTQPTPTPAPGEEPGLWWEALTR
jgi:cell division protein FtsL